MKDDRAGFWGAICAEPDEDGHRLVYADWLEDHGEGERAEFIRVQCELARLPFGDERRIDLQIRERALAEEHRDTWLKELPKWVPSWAALFRRGFPWSLSCKATTFLRKASALGGRMALQQVSFERPTRQDAERLAASPVCARVRSLETGEESYSYPADVLRPLLHAFTGLTEFTLDYRFHGGPNTADELAGLLAIPSVRQLARFRLRLHCRGAEADGRAVEALARASFTGLKALALEVPHLPPEALAALLAAPFVRGLEALSLQDSLLDAAGLEVLGSARGLAGLRSLGVALTSGAEGFAFVTTSRHLKRVTELTIGEFDQGSAAALARSGMAGRLRTLEVWSGYAAGGGRGEETDRAVRQLVASGRLKGLRRLMVVGGFPDVPSLGLDKNNLPALVHLDLRSTDFTEEALADLAGSPHLPSLRAVTVPSDLLDWPSRRAAGALRALNEEYAGRFAVLVAPLEAVTDPMRVGVY